MHTFSKHTRYVMPSLEPSLEKEEALELGPSNRDSTSPLEWETPGTEDDADPDPSVIGGRGRLALPAITETGRLVAERQWC